MNHPARARVAEVVVKRDNRELSRGSGYLVAADRVITAAHVVENAQTISVWLGVPLMMGRAARLDVDPERVMAFPGADLAILPVSRQSGLEVQDPPLFGVLDRDAGDPVPVVAAGCPRFKLRPIPGRPETQLREVHYASGRVDPRSNAKTETLELVVLAEVPADLEPERHSPWEGMSGAAVFAGSRIVGVVGQHELGEPNGMLTVRPIAAAVREAADAGRWWTALARAQGAPQDLDIVAVPTERQLVVMRAQRAARTVAPAVLVAREEEVQRLRAFIAGAEQYLWLEGPAFSGKTALLSWFVLHPGEGIDVAACFLRRTTGDADARYLVDVLGRQLAVYADRPYFASPELSTQRDDLLDLLDEASGACAQRGRRLLIVIDGLDEDQTVEPGLAIAAWLPGNDPLPANARLLVASRSGVDLPLAMDHPLKERRLTLAPSEAATGIGHAARVELNMARRGGGLAYPLLGTLAASVGDWAPGELTAALRAQGHADVLEVQVVDTLRSQLSRTVTAESPGGENAWIAFAHVALLEEARRLYAGDLSTLNDALLQWCHAALLSAESGSPLPRYVDRHYVDQLGSLDGWTPLWLDLLRPSWRAQRNSSPTAYLPLLDDLRRLDAAARAAGSAELASRIRAAAAIAEISGELETTSRELAAALVRSGRWSTARALNYLARLDNRDDLAMAMGVVAPVLAPDPETAGMVRALYDRLGEQSNDERGWAALGVASLLAAVGDPDGLKDFVRAQQDLGACETGNAAVGALRGLYDDDLEQMLDTISEKASSLGGFDLWRMAQRLAAIDGPTRARVETSLARSLGCFLLELLGHDSGEVDAINLGEALKIAAPLMPDSEQREELQRALASTRDRWGESDLLANVAEWAPTDLQDMIYERSVELAEVNPSSKHDRSLVAAGLLVRADEQMRRRLTEELRSGGVSFSSWDDRDEYVRRLAAGSLGSDALAYIRALAEEYDDFLIAGAVAAVAPELPPDLLPEALQLCEAMEPSWRSRARGAIYARAVELGRVDLIDLSAGQWSDAEQILHLTLQSAGRPRPPRDAWFRAAAVTQLAIRGEMPPVQCARLLLEGPEVIHMAELAAIIAMLSPDDDDVAAIHAMTRSGYGWLPPGRCIRDLLRAMMAAHGIHRVWQCLERGDAELQIYTTTACAKELADDDPGRLRRLLESHPEPLLTSAALVPVSDDPQHRLDQLCTRLSPSDLGEGRYPALRALEALSPDLRPVVLERLLDDRYLTGHRGYVGDYEWAGERLRALAHSLSPRQIDVVEQAVPHTGIGGRPRATLFAALANRRASLGDVEGFERTWRRISDSYVRVRTLLIALQRYPSSDIHRWLDLAFDFEPAPHAPQRAVLWPLAAQRFAEVPEGTAGELAQRWLDRATYRQPGELYADLPGLVALVRVAAGPDAERQLRDQWDLGANAR